MYCIWIQHNKLQLESDLTQHQQTKRKKKRKRNNNDYHTHKQENNIKTHTRKKLCISIRPTRFFHNHFLVLPLTIICASFYTFGVSVYFIILRSLPYRVYLLICSQPSLSWLFCSGNMNLMYKNSIRCVCIQSKR